MRDGDEIVRDDMKKVMHLIVLMTRLYIHIRVIHVLTTECESVVVHEV